MKTLLQLTCTKCGANLSIDEEREYVYCQYCGTKLILNNENEYVHRHIDEAKIKKAEAEKIVKLKELELEEKKIEQKAKNTKIKLAISFVLGIAGVISFMIDEFSLFGMFCIYIIFFIWIGSIKN